MNDLSMSERTAGIMAEAERLIRERLVGLLGDAAMAPAKVA